MDEDEGKDFISEGGWAYKCDSFDFCVFSSSRCILLRYVTIKLLLIRSDVSIGKIRENPCLENFGNHKGTYC